MRLTEEQIKSIVKDVVKTILEVKTVDSSHYMHISQAKREIPSDIFNKSLKLLKQHNPEYQFNCVMWSPKKNILRFDQSDDFDTITEPGISSMISVNYETGEVKNGRPTAAVWHERSLWVDDDYDGFDREADREWVANYRKHVKAHPELGKTPNGGSRAAWMNHLMDLGIIDHYFKVNDIQNPIAYLNALPATSKYPKGFLANKYKEQH